MQKLNEVNESVCNEAKQIGVSDEQQEYKGPVTRSRAKVQDQINPVVEKVPFIKMRESLRRDFPSWCLWKDWKVIL